MARRARAHFRCFFSSSKDPGDEKANVFLGFSKKAKKAVKVIGDVIVNGIVKVNGIYPYCSPRAAMRGENAARQRFSVQRTLHHGRDLRQEFSAHLAGAESAPTPAQKCGASVADHADFFARKKKWGWMPNAQIALSASKIAAARRKEHEWFLVPSERFSGVKTQICAFSLCQTRAPC